MSTPARSKTLPKVGELVMAIADQITPHGVYVSLEEYGGIEGFLHTSEVSSGWVKNIRDYVREGQRIVLKVIRVDRERQLIDLSLRRVSAPERKRKLLEWKLRRKAESLLSMVFTSLGLSERQAEAVKRSLVDNYGALYDGLKVASKRGVEALTEIGIAEPIAQAIAELAREKIKIPRVKLRSELKLSCPHPQGIEIIRRALIKAREATDLDVNIYTAGAPSYHIELVTEDPKLGEKELRRISEIAVQEVRASGGEASYKLVGK